MYILRSSVACMSGVYSGLHILGASSALSVSLGRVLAAAETSEAQGSATLTLALSASGRRTKAAAELGFGERGQKCKKSEMSV